MLFEKRKKKAAILYWAVDSSGTDSDKYGWLVCVSYGRYLYEGYRLKEGVYCPIFWEPNPYLRKTGTKKTMVNSERLVDEHNMGSKLALSVYQLWTQNICFASELDSILT